MVIHFVDGRLQKQHLHIAGAWQACAPASIKAFLVLILNRLLHTLSSILSTPRGSKRRIFDNKAHFRALKTVGLHGVLVTDILRILPLDHHLGQADGIGLRVDLLTKQAHIGRGVVTLYEIIAGGEHTTRATRLIQYGDDLSVIENIITAFCQQDIDHQLDNISAGVVVASFRIFRKSADQIFKYVTHFHVVNGVRIEIQLRERLYYREQSVVLVHLVDLLVKVQAADDVLNIGREALDVCLKVGRQVVGVVDQLCKIKFTGIVELETGQTVHRFRRIVWVGFIHFYNLCFGGCQGTLKAADDDHRDDDILVLVALICTTKFICNRPDEVYLCGYINGGIIPHRVYDFFFSHI